MENDLQESTTAVMDLHALLSFDGSFNEVAERAVELGASSLGVDHGHIARIVPELNHWKAVASTDAGDGPVPVGTIVDYQTTFCRHAVDTDDTIALSDVPNQGFADDIAYDSYGWECYASTPIRIDGELYGTLCFADNTVRPDSFGPTEVAFIDCLSEVLQQKLILSEQATAIANKNKLLEILSRVLRHNLRNDMTVVRGHLDFLLEEIDDPTVDSGALVSNVERIISLAEKSRELRRIAQTDPGVQKIAIDTLLVDLVDSIEREYPTAAFQVDHPKNVEVVTAPTIETALRELLENAAKHSEDPTCDVTVKPTMDAVHITIRDNGPGLPQQEQNVLDGERESALSHSQGIGLWIVHWAVRSFDGTVSTTVSDGGTTISVTIPRIDENEPMVEQSPSQQLLQKS